jgi:hypothetical protein
MASARDEKLKPLYPREWDIAYRTRGVRCTTALLFAGEVLLDLERAIRRASWNRTNSLFSIRGYYGSRPERQSRSEIVRN